MNTGDNGRIFLPPKKRTHWAIWASSLLATGFLLGTFLFLVSEEKSPVPVSPPFEEKPPAPPPEQILRGKISKGQNLSSALRAHNLSQDLVESIGRHLKPVVNLRKMKPGGSFEVHLNPQGRFLKFTYHASPLDVYQLTLSPSGDWLVAKKEVPVEKYWVRVSGKISSSLFEAMDQAGEQDSLTLDFADIFAWEIDFHSDLQPGDRFEMVVEEYFVEDTFVKYGRILYADFQRETRRHQAFLFEHPGGRRGDYFTPRGEALRKAFLRSPLKFTRISSAFSKSRYHPILGGNRPHLGVDYAAPPGSPVWAVADGTIVSCGWNGGYGKQIVIRHPRGYQSMYGHLSGFTPGIRIGKAVRQKQIIGYVGSTGLATGPHLDFRLLKNGAYRNPLREISPRDAPRGKDQMPELRKAMEPLLQWLRDPAALPKHRVASLNSGELEKSGVGQR